MEATAREKYEQLFGYKVHLTGVIVSPQQGWLCGSPDGLVKVGEEWVVLEIKCPSRCKDTDKVEVDYLMNNNTELKETHAYYTQVQLNMYLTGLSKAHLFVFSTKDSVLVEVPRDDYFL